MTKSCYRQLLHILIQINFIYISCNRISKKHANDKFNTRIPVYNAQRNTIVPTFCFLICTCLENTNKMINCDNMRANNNEINIFNQDHSYKRNVDVSLFRKTCDK